MKIICIARNYLEHVEELGNSKPLEPVFFLKPDSSLLTKNKPFFIPCFSDDIHYEVELVVKINRLGKYIEEKFAHKYYNHIGVGIDFTARDIQTKLKENSLPWGKAKAFDQSAVISQFLPLEEFKNREEILFTLEKNGVVVQKGNTKNMIFGINYLIAYVSKIMTLKIGDLIFTGTPSGEGKISKNDNLKAYLGVKKMIDFLVK